MNKKIQEDLQLVTLAALADIMPLQNENRILVRNGLQALNQGFVIDGLKELLARLNMLGKRIVQLSDGTSEAEVSSISESMDRMEDRKYD